VIMNIVEGTTFGGLPDTATLMSEAAIAAVIFAFTRSPSLRQADCGAHPCATEGNLAAANAPMRRLYPVSAGSEH
jgi:hypothetical protein